MSSTFKFTVTHIVAGLQSITVRELISDSHVDHAGALAAMFVGSTTLASSLRAGATLLAFYLSSSKLTRLKEEFKEVDEDFKKGGQRNWVQVCAAGCFLRLAKEKLQVMPRHRCNFSTGFLSYTSMSKCCVPLCRYSAMPSFLRCWQCWRATGAV